jgi:N-acetylmuramoyl-L-alanine amidase
MKIILDAGHGGLSPFNGEYVTKGKRSPKFDDGSVLYEGVNNRDNANRIKEVLEAKGYEVVMIPDTWKDTPLRERARMINTIKGEKILISIHSDGFGNGIDWNDANGIGVFKYDLCSDRTDILASAMNNSLICNFDGVAKNRGIRRANFAILRETNCPAILLELGFHTNKEEAQKMLTEDWKERIVKSVVEAIEDYIIQIG